MRLSVSASAFVLLSESVVPCLWLCFCLCFCLCLFMCAFRECPFQKETNHFGSGPPIKALVPWQSRPLFEARENKREPNESGFCGKVFHESPMSPPVTIDLCLLGGAGDVLREGACLEDNALHVSLLHLCQSIWVCPGTRRAEVLR